MIVKVQTNLNPPSGERVLIYNESRTVFWEGDATPELRKKLRGRPKAFFSARLHGTIVHLYRMVIDRDW